MSRDPAVIKTRILIVTVVAGNVTGNALLSRGLRHHELPSSLAEFLALLTNPWVAAGVALLALWMIANLSLLSRADLSYALPITGSLSYLSIAMVGRFVLGETIALIHWVGIGIITIGVFLVIETPPLTVQVHEPPEDER